MHRPRRRDQVCIQDTCLRWAAAGISSEDVVPGLKEGSCDCTLENGDVGPRVGEAHAVWVVL